MNYIITVELTLADKSEDEAVADVNELMAIYRNMGYIEEWEIVDVEALTPSTPLAPTCLSLIP